MGVSKTILVLGSNSFSGSHFVKSALSEGHRVLGVSRSHEISQEFRSYSGSLIAGEFSFHQLDVNHDTEGIAELSRDSKVEVVVNFSAQSMVAQSWTTPEDWYETNVVSLAKLARELSSVSTLGQFINFSTPEVYGTTDDWIKESFNFSPTTPYAVSRAAGDFHLRCLYDTFGFPVIFTRAANVYGPGQQLYRIIPKAILCGLLNRKLPLQGGGSSVRSFIHINDVSKALLRVMENGRLGDSYHVSTNRLITIHEVVELVARKLGMEMSDLVELSPERPGKDFAYKLSSEKIRNELDWDDSITLEDGISDTIDWARENLNSLSNNSTEYEHKR